MNVLHKWNITKLEASSIQQQVWISEELHGIFQWIIYVAACQTVSIVGTFGNVINIICFVKQGLKDSVNVNFLGLAISDMGCLLTLIFISIGNNPILEAADKPFDSLEMMYVTVGWPHIVFARVTSLITALITVERCLCIVIPLKVKTLITPKRVAVTIVSFYIVVIGSVIPVYCTNSLSWKFFPELNKTILGLTFSPDRDVVEGISYAFNNTVIPFSSFIVILICTFGLVIQLQKKSRWREESKSVHSAQGISNRDRKIARMVVMISILFIACYVPVCLIFMAMMFFPALTLAGENERFSVIACGVGFFLESLNSTLNIIIYYQMSTKYKETYRQLFRIEKQNG